MAKDVTARIEPFAKRLETSLGENLISLTLYGSAARDYHVGERSDVNLLLIVRNASTSSLRDASEPLAEWMRAGETPPLIFSDEDWRASADVFPIEVEDMREAHRVIRGTDPLQGITTDRAHLRQQLEREVRGKLLHLRTEFVAVAGDPKLLGRLLQNSLSTFLVLFRATLRLSGVKPPLETPAVVRETARAAGFSAAPFEWALAARSGVAPAPLKAFDPLGAQYVDAIEQLARFVNGL